MPTIDHLGQQLDIQPGETILEALLRQGQVASYSCRKGSCTNCVLKLEAGSVRHSREIDAQLLASGHLLPCVAYPESDIRLGPPDLQQVAIEAELLARHELTPGIHELHLAPMRQFSFLPGQHVQLMRADGLARPYSIVSQSDEDYFFRLHVRRLADGTFSRWLCDEARPGERLHVLGPGGHCHYDPTRHAGHPLLLLATGTGAGTLLAIANDALTQQHRAPIHFFHGAHTAADLYLHETLCTLAQRHPHFTYHACTSQSAPPDGGTAGRITDALSRTLPDLSSHMVFLCGNPSMVEDARYLAILGGARRQHIHADPFEYSHPSTPHDAQKIARIPADPDLWAMLEEGPMLSRILSAFYDKVYEDERLSPFFLDIPKPFVIQKQYEFMANLFSGGQTGYFGLNPYNAHHWMVISDDLFDHREDLYESVLHDFKLPIPMIRRWMAIHELFRAEMVKSAPRGMILRGQEQPLRTVEVDRLDMDTVCDGCGEEIPAGTPVRYQHRIGKLHCAACAGLAAPTHTATEMDSACPT